MHILIYGTSTQALHFLPALALNFTLLGFVDSDPHTLDEQAGISPQSAFRRPIRQNLDRQLFCQRDQPDAGQLWNRAGHPRRSV